MLLQPEETVDLLATMAAPPLRRGFQAVAICCAAGLLFVLSFTLTFTGFVAWHVLSTRPHHTIPFSFELLDLPRSHPALQAYASLTETRGLRSVQSLRVSLRLLLPESSVNLDNSVFHVSAELYGRPIQSSRMLNATKLAHDPTPGPALCLAHGSAQATLKYRSPVYRAIRATVLAGPLLLGLAREYQTVVVETLQYHAVAGEDGTLPQLEGVRVQLYPADVQVAEARMTLRVGRRGFVRAMVSEKRVPTFVVVALGLWYGLLVVLAVGLAMASALWKAVAVVWRAVMGGGEEESGGVGDMGEASEQVSQVSTNRPKASAALPPRFAGAGKAPGRTVGSGNRTVSSGFEGDGLRKRTSSSVTRVT